METGEKEFTIDLRGRGGGGSKLRDLAPPPDPPHGRPDEVLTIRV